MTAKDDYILKVSNLNVRFQNQIILDNISFNVKKGTTMAILGPNGAGKSVLFRTLLNLVPYNGNVEWSEKKRVSDLARVVSSSARPGGL